MPPAASGILSIPPDSFSRSPISLFMMLGQIAHSATPSGSPLAPASFHQMPYHQNIKNPLSLPFLLNKKWRIWERYPYEKIITQFYPLRHSRLVPGNFLYSFKFIPPEGIHLKREHLCLDVPHLWYGCFSLPCMPDCKEVPFSYTRLLLCAAYLHWRIYHRFPFNAPGIMPLELRTLQMEYQKSHTPGLSPLLDICRFAL